MLPICRVEFVEAKAAEFDPIASARRLIEDASNLFSDDRTTAFCDASLPDLIFAIGNDNAKLLVSAHEKTPYNSSNIDSQYPARFRIPPSTLYGLCEEECKKRSQRFAVGSLLYTVMAGGQPFEDLDEKLAQQNFEQGVYPDETRRFPLEIAIQILGLWSQEFVEQCIKHCNHLISPPDQASKASKISERIHEHPISTGVAAIGLGLFGLASIVNPALGIVGFSTLGPAAGTAAAAWQSSIGIVQAGSIFAWCQSVAMGGSAAAAIAAAQGVGAGVTGLAALGMLSSPKDEQAEMVIIWNVFKENVRKVDGGEAKE